MNNAIIKFFIPTKKIDINPKAAFKALSDKDNDSLKKKWNGFWKKWKGNKEEECRRIPYKTIILQFSLVSIVVQLIFGLGTGVIDKLLDLIEIPSLGKYDFINTILFFIPKLMFKFLVTVVVAPSRLAANIGFGLFMSFQAYQKLRCCDNCNLQD